MADCFGSGFRHASIQITVDTYGHLIPGANRAAVDRLDDEPMQLDATQAQPDDTGDAATLSEMADCSEKVVSHTGIEPPVGARHSRLVEFTLEQSPRAD